MNEISYVNTLISTGLFVFPFFRTNMLKQKKFYYSFMALAVLYYMTDYAFQPLMNLITSNSFLRQIGFYMSWNLILNSGVKLLLGSLFLKINTEKGFWHCLVSAELCGIVLSIGDLLSTFLIFYIGGSIWDYGQTINVIVWYFEVVLLLFVRRFLIKNDGISIVRPGILCCLFFLIIGQINIIKTVYGMLCSLAPEYTLYYARVLIYAVLSLLLILYILHQSVVLERKSQEEVMMKRNLAISRSKIDDLKNNEIEIIRFNHMIRHHLRILKAFLDEENYSAADTYIQKTVSELDNDDEMVSYAENIYVNAVINYISKKEKDISIIADEMLGNDTGLDPVDIGIVTMNLLESGISQIRKKNLEKTIWFYALRREDIVCLSVSYEKDGTEEHKDSEQNNYVEMTVMKNIIDKYHGEIINSELEKCRTDVLLNIPNDQKNNQVNMMP